MALIGLDIGGTKCAAVLGDRDGRVLARRAFLTAEESGWQGAIARLIAESRALLGGETPEAVGISCGGPLDSEAGVILSPPNLPGWDHVPVAEIVSEALGAPAYLQNDANACALAEWLYGAGRGARNLIFLTFGTGLGAGLILDGRLYEGASGLAGEAGHIRLSPRGPVGYRKAGSFEGFCSGGGLSNLARMRLGEAVSAKELCARADAGDEKAARVLRESARRLGQGLAILVDLFNPDTIVIGSVFARSQRWFRPDMEKALAREALPEALAVCKIVPAQLGDALGDCAALAVAAANR